MKPIIERIKDHLSGQYVNLDTKPETLMKLLEGVLAEYDKSRTDAATQEYYRQCGYAGAADLDAITEQEWGYSYSLVSVTNVETAVTYMNEDSETGELALRADKILPRRLAMVDFWGAVIDGRVTENALHFLENWFGTMYERDEFGLPVYFPEGHKREGEYKLTGENAGMNKIVALLDKYPYSHDCTVHC